MQSPEDLAGSPAVPLTPPHAINAWSMACWMYEWTPEVPKYSKTIQIPQIVEETEETFMIFEIQVMILLWVLLAVLAPSCLACLFNSHCEPWAASYMFFCFARLASVPRVVSCSQVGMYVVQYFVNILWAQNNESLPREQSRLPVTPRCVAFDKRLKARKRRPRGTDQSCQLGRNSIGT